MRKILVTAYLMLVVTGIQTVNAQTATEEAIAKFNQIMDIGELVFPELLAPSATTFTANELGSTWAARDYGFLTGSGAAVAVNLTGGAGFSPGDIWAIGLDGGDTPEFVGPVDDVLAQALALAPDDNGNGGGDGGGGDGGDGGGDGGDGGDGNGNAILAQGGGSCIDLTDAMQGTVAMYEGQQTVDLGDGSDPVSGTVSYTTTYTNVTSDSATTQTDQDISAGGFTANSVSTTTSYFERMNGWLFTTETDSEVTSNFAGFPSSTSTTNTTFSPSQASSPLTLCNGMIFRIGEVTSTSTGTNAGVPLPPSTAQTSVSIVETYSVNEPLQVPAGSFTTVHQKIESIDDNDEVDGYTEAWFINSAGGVPARIDIYLVENGVETMISSVLLHSLSI